jgi:hypothetical protein
MGMNEVKPLREIYDDVKAPGVAQSLNGGFYTPEWRKQQGDAKDQELHQRALDRRDQGLAGNVDGSGRLREGK